MTVFKEFFPTFLENLDDKEARERLKKKYGKVEDEEEFIRRLEIKDEAEFQLVVELFNSKCDTR